MSEKRNHKSFKLESNKERWGVRWEKVTFILDFGVNFGQLKG